MKRIRTGLYQEKFGSHTIRIMSLKLMDDDLSGWLAAVDNRPVSINPSKKAAVGEAYDSLIGGAAA